MESGGGWEVVGRCLTPLEFLKGTLSPPPLGSLRLCFAHVERVLTVAQVSLSLGFGKHTVTLLNRPSISSNLTPRPSP